MYVLAHETAHALCDTKKCKCGIGSNTHHNRDISEYHAFKFAGKWLLKNKCKDALCFYVERIAGHASTCCVDKVSSHTKACRKIMKLKLWEKMQEIRRIWRINLAGGRLWCIL